MRRIFDDWDELVWYMKIEMVLRLVFGIALLLFIWLLVFVNLAFF